MKTNQIFVIVPCLDEESSIKQTIREIRRFLPDSSIVVVDNGSKDHTREIARSEGVKVLVEPKKGKGFAVRNALSRMPSDCDVVFITDGDDTYSAEPVLEAVSLIRDAGYDMIIGKRESNSEDESPRGKIFRLGHATGNRLLTRVFRLLFPVEITDTLSGWRVMSRGFAKSFTGGASGFEIETELNAHAYLLKCGVKEIPVLYKGRGKESYSKLKTIPDGLRILRMNLHLFRSERPYFAFVLTALPWSLMSLFLLLRSLNDYFRTGLVPHFPSLIAGIGSFTVSALLWVTGMILERVRMSREASARALYSASTI